MSRKKSSSIRRRAIRDSRNQVIRDRVNQTRDSQAFLGESWSMEVNSAAKEAGLFRNLKGLVRTDGLSREDLLELQNMFKVED